MCINLFCLMMHVLNYCLFLYKIHILYKRQNFSNTTCRCKLRKLDFFNMFFYQYSIIWIQLTFYLFYFIIQWSILGSTFLPKILCIYNDIKKIIQYFWIDMKLNIPLFPFIISLSGMTLTKHNKKKKRLITYSQFVSIPGLNNVRAFYK